MVTISTVAKFESAHRQIKDPSKCGRLHGHNWEVKVTIDSDNIGEIGYVTDFKNIKEYFDQYDHVVLLHEEDPLVNELIDYGQRVETFKQNPTCECLAELFAVDIAQGMIDHGNKPNFVMITVFENKESFASSVYRPGIITPPGVVYENH